MPAKKAKYPKSAEKERIFHVKRKLLFSSKNTARRLKPVLQHCTSLSHTLVPGLLFCCFLCYCCYLSHSSAFALCSVFVCVFIFTFKFPIPVSHCLPWIFGSCFRVFRCSYICRWLLFRERIFCPRTVYKICEPKRRKEVKKTRPAITTI